jgi:hypothetical protein
MFVLCALYSKDKKGKDSRWGHWGFFIDLIPAATLWSWGRLKGFSLGVKADGA